MFLAGVDRMDHSALVFSTQTLAPKLTRWVQAGRARRLSHGVYTLDLRTDPAALLRRNWLEVVAHYFPGAIICDRSAYSARSDTDGHLFVVHERSRPLGIPGLLIVPRPGAGPLKDDMQLPHGLWLSSRQRALVENLRP